MQRNTATRPISICILIALLSLAGCNSKEVARLQQENDSLRHELTSGRNVLVGITDVRGLLDSIDASRNALRTNLSEGTTYEEVTSRLRDINQFVQMSEDKIRIIQDELQASHNEASAYLMLVDALKSEVQIRVDEIVKLQEQVVAFREENADLQAEIRLKEDEVRDINIRISEKEQELLHLESRIAAMVEEFRVSEADAFYARARAVEEAANRTKLAPQKKRETYREALELYKHALRLGNQDARADISRLEEKAK